MTDAGSDQQTASDERALAQFRQQYYGLLVGLFSKEPAAELLDGLRTGIAERAVAARSLHPLLGDGWEMLEGVLPDLTAEAAADEFMKVFIGPFQAEIVPFESWYICGQLFQAPLIALRAFLGQVGLERQEEAYPDPEDALAFELEIMNWLLTRQMAAQTPEEESEWLHRQAAFLRQHLLIWGPHCAQDIEGTKSATLYKGAALLLKGLLAIEKQRLQGAGIEDFETLDHAKRRYGAPRAFQGPMFDPGTPPKTKGTPS